MKLLCELNDNIEYIVEGTDKNKDTYIQGIFMQSEMKNRNGRVYPKKIMESAVNKYISEQVVTSRSVGELNHPDGPTINLDKVSHLITELTWDGDDVIGKAKVLNTPMGLIAKGLIEGGVKLGVSSRGMGSVVNRNGTSMVGEDYMINAVDIVQDPSASKAFVESVMENVDWVYDAVHGSWQKQEIIEATVKKIKCKPYNEDTAVKELKELFFKL